MDKVKYVVCYHDPRIKSDITESKFCADDVIRLERQVAKWGSGRVDFLCYTNDPYLWNLDERFKPLERPERTGWGCLPEKFRVKGAVIFTGLDTIVSGPLDEFVDLALNCPPMVAYMMHPFKLPNPDNRMYSNGIMIWNGDLSWLYKDYDYSYVKKKIVKKKNIFEQDYTAAMLIKNGYDIRAVQNHTKGFVSEKYHLRGLDYQKPADCNMVIFQGPMTPAILSEKVEWINECHKV